MFLNYNQLRSSLNFYNVQFVNNGCSDFCMLLAYMCNIILYFYFNRIFCCDFNRSGVLGSRWSRKDQGIETDSFRW